MTTQAERIEEALRAAVVREAALVSRVDAAMVQVERMQRGQSELAASLHESERDLRVVKARLVDQRKSARSLLVKVDHARTRLNEENSLRVAWQESAKRSEQRALEAEAEVTRLGKQIDEHDCFSAGLYGPGYGAED